MYSYQRPVKMIWGIQRKYVLLSLLAGMGAGFVAIWIEGIYIQDVFWVYSESTLFVIIVVCVIAPLVEESVKPLGLYLIRTEENPDLSIRDWTILGVLAGFGFGFLENLLYGLTLSFFNAEAGLLLFAIRSGLPLHMITTGIASYGYGLSKLTGKILDFGKYLGIAVLIHGLFNFAAIMI